jgi:uncharacterized protein YgiM (DUF1202 family)
MNLKLTGLASALPVALGLGATIATAPASPGAGAPETVAAVVARTSVLHSGPASNSISAGTIAKGTVVSVLGPRPLSGYVKIETPDDEVGWVSERNLHSVDAATPSPTLSANPTRVGPTDIYPDPTRTPGATNPDITQANIGANICNPSWSTKTIRPPVSYTNPLKTQQIREYGYADKNLADYEEDHLISLELGGSPTDPKNLWPEPYKTTLTDGGARFKDRVENYLHDQVCAGKLTLQEAQQQIVGDWYQVYGEAFGVP